MSKIKVVIADDHALFRAGLIQLIESLDEFEVLAEASDGESLLELLTGLDPDLLVIDHDMPGASGLDVVGRLNDKPPGMKIMLVTGIEAEQLMADYSELNVDGIVLKSDDLDTLKEALVSVIAGRRYLSRQIRTLVERATATENLTSRERQVVRHIAQGLSNKEISRMMGIAPKTVDTHRTNLMQKLDLHNVAEVVAFAVKSGLT
ncbi:MAG: DNA-binding response regulator [Gammaproteobacteria bacterium]|jgi:DNA-binding NarL/FixJ family response regulator|nr:DNA-binding response regulator [Gammaproteobacteria bacterium]|tara:strand:- start:7203 stop:7817 length:615 start_codon:yes stop_codon:yes gene_type:complete